jgi:hypothetical protein
MATINIYHITEQAGQCGQQTVEVHAESLDKALQVYIYYSVADSCHAIIREDNMTTYIFPDEKLEIIHETEYRVFAKWTSFKGLY